MFKDSFARSCTLPPAPLRRSGAGGTRLAPVTRFAKGTKETIGLLTNELLLHVSVAKCAGVTQFNSRSRQRSLRPAPKRGCELGGAASRGERTRPPSRPPRREHAVGPLGDRSICRPPQRRLRRPGTLYFRPQLEVRPRKSTQRIVVS